MTLRKADERQARLLAWAVETFGSTARNLDERAARLVEEAIEVAQAAGLPLQIIDRIMGRVYGRPPGELRQEIGGTAFTLASLAEVAGLSVETELEREWTRVRAIPREHFARKHAAKVVAGTADLTPA